jgi:hypothetical protein
MYKVKTRSINSIIVNMIKIMYVLRDLIYLKLKIFFLNIKKPNEAKIICKQVKTGSYVNTTKTKYVFRDEIYLKHKIFFSKNVRKPTEANIICKVDKIEAILVRDEISLKQKIFFLNIQKTK